MTDWPELEDAKRRKEEERLRQLRELDAEFFTEELEAKLPKLIKIKAVRRLITPNQDELFKLVQTWDNPVSKLLTQIALAIWPPDPRGKANKWWMESKVVEGAQPDLLALSWEVHYRGFYISKWLVVELMLDNEIQPVEFKVGCKEIGFFLTAPPDLESLKAVLLQAFEFGAASDESYKIERKPGILFSELQQ